MEDFKNSTAFALKIQQTDLYVQAPNADEEAVGIVEIEGDGDPSIYFNMTPISSEINNNGFPEGHFFIVNVETGLLLCPWGGLTDAGTHIHQYQRVPGCNDQKWFVNHTLGGAICNGKTGMSLCVKEDDFQNGTRLVLGDPADEPSRMFQLEKQEGLVGKIKCTGTDDEFYIDIEDGSDASEAGCVISEADGASDKSVWKIARVDDAVGPYSISALSEPGSMLRHQNYTVYSHNEESVLPRQDATWMIRPALSGASGFVSLIPVQFPDHVLRHQNSKLLISPTDEIDIIEDTAFRILPVSTLSAQGQASVSNERNNELQEQIDANDDAIAEKDAVINEKDEEIESLKSQIEDLTAQVEGFEGADPEELEREKGALQAQNEEMEETIQELRNKIEEQSSQLQEGSGGVEELESRVSEISVKMQEEQARADEAEAKLAEVGEAADMAQELAAQNAKVESLEARLEFLYKHIANEDAVRIRKACKGFGTNDKALIAILGNRSKEHISRIDSVYKEKYGKSLVEQVSAECSGAYKDFLVYTLTDKVPLAVRFIHEAVKGFGTNETKLAEVLATLYPEQMEEVKANYESLHGCPLIDKINSELSGTLQRTCQQLVQGTRAVGEEADEARAEEQAEMLYQAGEAKMFGTDTDVFIQVLTQSSYAQLEVVKAKYEEAHNRSLVRAIKKEFSGDRERLMLMLLDPPLTAFAKLLRRAFEGMGCNDRLVARVLGRHTKAEAIEIGEEYARLYNEPLIDRIQKELSGNFKLSAMAWVGHLAVSVAQEGEN